MSRFAFAPIRNSIISCVLLCAVSAGCAAPARTFVSEANAKQRRRAEVPAEPAASILKHPPLDSSSSECEPHPDEPSAWSKWIGAFNPAKPTPAPRIPLPRTDKESEGINDEFPTTDAAEFSSF